MNHFNCIKYIAFCATIFAPSFVSAGEQHNPSMAMEAYIATTSLSASIAMLQGLLWDEPSLDFDDIANQVIDDHIRQVSDLAELHLQQFEGVDAYKNYEQLVHTLNRRLRIARENSRETAALATQAFNAGEYDLVAQYSKQELDVYPVVIMNGIRFKIFSDVKMVPENKINYFRPMDPFEPIRHFAHRNGYVKFYKVIPEKHLCSIQIHGLDSKFGGLGGASQTIPGFSNLASTYDRGKMFFNYGYVTSDYNAGFKAQGVNLKHLLVKIPIELCQSLNLTTNYLDEWFIAGNVIPPEYIYVKSEMGFVPIAQVNCQ